MKKSKINKLSITQSNLVNQMRDYRKRLLEIEINIAMLKKDITRYENIKKQIEYEIYSMNLN